MVLGAAFLVVLVLCRVLVATAYQVTLPRNGDYGAYQCRFAGGDGPALRILDAVYLEELEVVLRWCELDELAAHFGSLRARSVHRDRFDLRELYESRQDLVLAKPEMVETPGTTRDAGVGYEMIARYPDYGSQLVSLAGVPRLSAAWMKGRTLGLLDDPNSVSAYQIPRAALRNSDLEDAVEIVYFRTYRQMYRAFFDGEVDVIPALVSREGPDSSLQLPPGLVLQETLPGPAWYLRAELLQSPVHCALEGALRQFANVAGVDYFRRIEWVERCGAAG